MKTSKILFMSFAVFSIFWSACSLNNNNVKNISDEDVIAKKDIPEDLGRNYSSFSVNSSGEATRIARNDWFSFFVPKTWYVTVDAESDKEYKVYEFKVFPPSENAKMPSLIYLSYYSENNEDIETYQEFIRVNSQNVLRRGNTVEWEKYEPVTEKTVAGRKAFVVARNCRHFLHPNSKDDTYVMKKEKMYVMPAKKGYYVIRYGAEEDNFDKNLAAFEDIAESFKGLY